MTTTESPGYSDYLSQVKDNPNIAYLGYLCWWYVPENLTIAHDNLVQLLQVHGLEEMKPPVPRDKDIFERTCTTQQRRRVPTGTDNRFENYLLRPVGRDSDKVYRRLVVETVDGANKKLDFAQLADLIFDRSTATVSVRPLRGQLKGTAAEVVESVLHAYQDERGHLNGMAIRAMFRNQVTRMHATAVRPSGGVYFLAAEHGSKVEALEATARLLGEAEFHSLPLIDDVRQRQMLRRAFEAESIDEIDGLIREMTKIAKEGAAEGKKITQGRFLDLKSRYDDLRKRVREYSDLLEVALDTTGARLEVAGGQVTGLFDHVEFKDAA